MLLIFEASCDEADIYFDARYTMMPDTYEHF